MLTCMPDLTHENVHSAEPSHTTATHCRRPDNNQRLRAANPTKRKSGGGGGHRRKKRIAALTMFDC